MITFDKDGVTLVGYDGTGTRFAHNYLEGSLYDDMLAVRTRQIKAAGENTAAPAAYLSLLEQYTTNYQRPGCPPLPVKPQQRVISDLGVEAHVPFVPALPDFVAPHVDPPGGIKVDVPDKQAIMYNMILALFHKAFPDA